jgi:hypothetical protein
MSDVGIVLEEEVMSHFILDWLCSASVSYGLPLGPSSFILPYLPPPSLAALLLSCDVSCDV